MARTVVALRCVKCGTQFKKSFEQKRGNPDLADGEMVRLDGSTCPNTCGGDWFSITKRHPIRKFKRHY